MLNTDRNSMAYLKKKEKNCNSPNKSIVQYYRDISRITSDRNVLYLYISQTNWQWKMEILLVFWGYRQSPLGAEKRRNPIMRTITL